MADSLCCATETNTVLWSNYTLIKIYEKNKLTFSSPKSGLLLALGGSWGPWSPVCRDGDGLWWEGWGSTDLADPSCSRKENSGPGTRPTVLLQGHRRPVWRLILRTLGHGWNGTGRSPSDRWLQIRAQPPAKQPTVPPYSLQQQLSFVTFSKRHVERGLVTRGSEDMSEPLRGHAGTDTNQGPWPP